MNQAIYFVISLVIQAFLISCGMIHAGVLVEEGFILNFQEIGIFAFIDVIKLRHFTLMVLVLVIVLFLINIGTNLAHTSVIILAFTVGHYIGMELVNLIATILYCRSIEIINIIASIHAQWTKTSTSTLIDLVWQLAQLHSFLEQKQA